MGTLIRATNLWGYEELVQALGGDPHPLLARFHIPAASERTDELFLSYRNGALLIEATATELDCPDFGIRLAKWQGLEMLGPIAVIARNADNVQHAFEAIARYLFVHSPALRLRIEPARSAAWLRFDYKITELSAPRLRQSYELSMANAMRILRLLAGQQARPQMVSFMHHQIGSDEKYAKFFDCKVQFEQDWCGWQLSTALAHQSIDHADTQTWELATAYLESRYVPGTAPLSARVTELISRLLPTGLCNAETIAAELAIHPRTLQRRLAQEGLRYDELLDRERNRQAEQYLCESGLYLTQITGLLGYAEQSTFNRSCQRWFGTTPKKFRARMQAADH